VTGHGALKTGKAYLGGYYKFSDEGGKAKDGNLLYFIEPDDVAQYDWFVPKKTAGLTKAGLARINESIEAFVYCILGAQVNVRSSIIGEGGRAKEAQTEFLTLMEGSISQPDLAKSVQGYQLAVDQAKVRLNLAVAPMAWLMAANMIINTASVVGYNNKLKQVVSGSKLGVNNELNTDTKKSALKLMEGGPSKISSLNSHPSNPVQQGVFGEEADGLGSGVEKEVRDLANQLGQQRAKLSPDFFEAAGHCFSGCFQSFGYRADNCPNSDASGKKDSRNSNVVFFEDFL